MVCSSQCILSGATCWWYWLSSLGEGGSARSPHCLGTINEYLMEMYFETVKVTCYSLNFRILVLASIDDSYLRQWWLDNFLFSLFPLYLLFHILLQWKAYSIFPSFLSPSLPYFFLFLSFSLSMWFINSYFIQYIVFFHYHYLLWYSIWPQFGTGLTLKGWEQQTSTWVLQKKNA